MADETASTTTSTETAAPDAPAPAPAGDAPVADATAPEATALGGAGDSPADSPADADAPAADDPATDGDKPAGPPDAYELTAPEGMALNKEALDAAVPVFRELGLSNEQAQKLMPVAGEFAKKIADGFNQQIISQVAADRKAWLDTAKADPEIGAGNWDKTLATAAQGLDRLGFPKGSPLRVLLDESGLGNHPDMIRAWARVGKAVGEDSEFVRSEQGGTAKKSDAELFYPAFVKRPE